jgi:acetyltransferase-like isoleucine patch superfamily enzyme
MNTQRLTAFWRILCSRDRHYSLVAYLFGALLPGRRSGAGPVAWVRGWPMPDVRPGSGRIELGHVGLYPGVRLHCRGTGQIAIGEGTFINRQARVFAGSRVHLGRNCMVSWQTVITDCTCAGPVAAFDPVVLEDEVWLGSRVVILGGTRLGRGCIVAAGSVVQGSFPAGSILAGKPAEVIG